MTAGTSAAQARLGFLEAVAAAALWGSSGIFAVELFRLGVPPTTLALLRMALGTAFLVIWAALSQRRELAVGRKGLLLLLLGGGIPMGGFQVVYQLSIDSVGVPTTVALLYLAPVFVVAASAPLLRERPTAVRVALSVLVVAGVWLTVLGADEVAAVFGTRSLAWGVLAGVCYAAYTLFGRYAAPRWGTVATVVFSSLGATLVLTATVPFLSDTVVLPTEGRTWAVLVVFALLTVTLASLLFFDALRRIEASRVAVAAAAEPVVAGLLATLMLSQGLDVVGWLGIGLVTVGVAAVGFLDGRS